MNPRPSISAVFPAYNDAGTIPSMVLRAVMTLRALTDDYEVIVTNDGSADYTGAVLDELATAYPCLRVIHHPQNRGYGHALRSGFGAATKDLVFYTDGDAQYDPDELALLYPEMKPGIDIVNGYKISRNDPWHRVVIGRIYHHLMRLLFGYPIRDVDCDFRLIRRACFDAVTLESPDGTLPLEMVKKFHDAGFRFAEVPVHHFHRVYGRSQFFNIRRLVRVVGEILRMWWKLVVKREHVDGSRPLGAVLRSATGRFLRSPKAMGGALVLAALTYLGIGMLLATIGTTVDLLCAESQISLVMTPVFWLVEVVTWPVWPLMDVMHGTGCSICQQVMACFQ